jgi:hypothetical protein
MEKGLEGCYGCGENCGKGLLQKIKPRAFRLFVQRYGIGELMDCLERNEKNGVVYHREGITGDYDDFEDEEQLIRFLREGKKERQSAF